MAAPLVRHQPQNNESSTRIKQAAESEPDDRNALVPGPPQREVKMKIPRGMPVLPGGRRMPPLPVFLRESLAPLRRSLAPLRRSLAPLLGEVPSEDERVLTRRRRWPIVVTLLGVLALSVIAYLSFGWR